MENFIYLKVKSDLLFDGLNTAFKQYQQSIYDQYGITDKKPCDIEVYFLRKGISLGTDKVSQADSGWAHYPLVRRIESMFIGFASTYRDQFLFNTPSGLGYVSGITEEEFDSLVPESTPYSNGKTWREWLNGQTEVKDGVTYYPMHTLYNNGSRNTNPDQDEFWAVYDYFGSERIKLAYEILVN